MLHLFGVHVGPGAECCWAAISPFPAVSIHHIFGSVVSIRPW